MNNIKKTLFPFPIDMDKCHKWAIELEIPKRSDVILYTSCLYQMIPYINSMVDFLEKADNSSFWQIGLKLLGRFPSLASLSKIFIKVSDRDFEPIYNILKSIVFLLRKSGVEFGYLYQDDIYCGALLYDLGLDQLFAEHARKVEERLRKNNVRKIITIDPHTHHTFCSLYPKYLDTFDYEVISYLEILDSRLAEPLEKISGTYTIHDACLYARWENIISQPRNLLCKIGVELVEPRKSGAHTNCCGGPVESLAPKIAKAVAEGRIQELKEVSNRAITLCPICFANLSRYATKRGLEIFDIATILAKSYRT